MFEWPDVIAWIALGLFVHYRILGYLIEKRLASHYHFVERKQIDQLALNESRQPARRRWKN